MKIKLVSKVIGALVFLMVATFNIILVFKKDSHTGNLSLNVLQARAQTYNGGELDPVDITSPCNSSYGTCHALVFEGYCEAWDEHYGQYTEVQEVCDFTGETSDRCCPEDETECLP